MLIFKLTLARNGRAKLFVYNFPLINFRPFFVPSSCKVYKQVSFQKPKIFQHLLHISEEQ